MATRNKRSDGEEIRMINFEYDGETYNMSAIDTATFFGVNYDTVYGGVARKGLTDQEAADFAAEKGQHYPRKKAIRDRILYKTGLRA